MADLSELLAQVMANPQLRSQMADMAQSLGLQTEPQSASHRPAPEPGQKPSCDKPPSDSGSGAQPQSDAHLLAGNLLRMMQCTSRDSKQLALIQALKPFLQPDRIRKLERAVQIAQMSRLAEQALHTLTDQAGDFHV